MCAGEALKKDMVSYSLLIACGVVKTCKKAYFCELSHCTSSMLRSREIGYLADSPINLEAGFFSQLTKQEKE